MNRHLAPRRLPSLAAPPRRPSREEKKRQGTPSMFFASRSFRPRPLLACTASPSSCQFHAAAQSVALRSTSAPRRSDLPILRSPVRLRGGCPGEASFHSLAVRRRDALYSSHPSDSNSCTIPYQSAMGVKQKPNGAGAVRACDSVPAAAAASKDENKAKKRRKAVITNQAGGNKCHI